jgi:LPXTG-motif cell wall-anchored protein
MAPPRPHSHRTLAAILATTTTSLGLLIVGPTAAHAVTVSDDVLVQAADASGLVVVDVLANDADAVSIASVTQPGVGSATIAGATVQVAYPATFAGDVAFAYTAVDGEGVAAEATVRVTITNDAPVAADDTGATATEPVRIDVLANDVDPNGDALTITAVDVAVAQGEAWIEPAGTTAATRDVVVFAPAATFAGDATITYEVADSRGATASAAIAVPVLGPDPYLEYDVVQTVQGRPVVVDAFANDVDPLGRTLTYDSWAVDELTYGDLALDDRGTPADASDDVLVFTPEPGFVGVMGFRYIAATPQGARFVGFGQITVLAPHPVTQEDHATTAYGTPVVVDVLANDADPFGEGLTIVAVQADASQGTATIVDGRVRFVPLDGFVGRTLVTYHVVNAEGYPAAQVVAITVAPPVTAAVVDAAPGAAAGQGRLPETGTGVVGPVVASLALLLMAAGALLLVRRRLA